MPAIRFSQRKIESLISQPRTKRTSYHDPAFPGLRLIIGPRGGVWYFFKRIDGRQTRMRLGAWPSLGIADARAKSRELELAAEDGKHPKAVLAREAAERAEALQKDKAQLVAVLAETWQQHHFPTIGDRTRADYAVVLRQFMAAFGGRDAKTITRGELVRYLDSVALRSGAQANRTASVLRQLFSWAQDRLDMESNPAATIKNPAKTKRRSRTLSRDEIRVLWRACELAGYPYGHALRLALCTGQRIGEVGFLRWQDIEGDYWANTENKADTRIDIYIAPLAREVIDDCPHVGDYVFSASGGRIGLRSDTWAGQRGALRRHIWKATPAAAEQLGAEPRTEHFTAHDIRRTVRTGLTGWAGVLPDTAERVLNHALGGLRAHYDYADYRPHVAEALRLWDAELRRIRSGLVSQVDARQTA